MYRKEYIDYLVHFHTKRDYFECHEIGEEYWKEKAGNEEKSAWLFLIQLSVSKYHWRRGNYIGAYRLISKALKEYRSISFQLYKLGLNTVLLRIQLEWIQQKIYDKERYVSIQFPFVDQILVDLCKEEAGTDNWIKESNLNDNFIINKHKLRDRNEIIQVRQQKLIKKSNLI